MLGSNCTARLYYMPQGEVFHLNKVRLASLPEGKKCSSWQELLEKVHPDLELVVNGETELIVRKKMKLLCESVCFSYSGKQWIFEDYNRVFTSGITILKGYSGCGKTTLLKILAGYLKPQSGRVITPRRKVQADSLYRRKEVSYMFQGLNLLPLATVERNLQLCAEMAMLPKKQWTRRADDLITRLGLESLRHKKAGELVRRPGPAGGSCPHDDEGFRCAAAGRTYFRPG